MKELTVSRLSGKLDIQSLPAIAAALEQITAQPVDVLNWKDAYPYCPEVSFRLAYDDKNFYLRYDVREKHIRAKATDNNGPVWLDSCVEFFLSPENNEEYYNLECSCIGTKLLGYKKRPSDTPQHATVEIMNNIRCESSLGSQPFDERTGDFSWQLVAVIPLHSFWNHTLGSLEGKTMHANFYKCGDELTEPHFLSWNPIQTLEPSFHQPGFFGKLIFSAI